MKRIHCTCVYDHWNRLPRGSTGDGPPELGALPSFCRSGQQSQRCSGEPVSQGKTRIAQIRTWQRHVILRSMHFGNNHLAVRWCIENFGCSVHGQKVSEIGPLEGRLIQYGSSRGPPILRMQYLTILRGSPKCASQQSRKGTFSSSGWPHSPNMCKGVFNVRKGFVRRLNSMRPWSNGGTVTELACNNQTWQWKHIPSEDDVTCQQCSKISCWFMILGDDTIQHGNYHHPWNPQQPTSIMKWQRFFFCLAHVCHGQNLDCVPILGDGHRSINMD